MIPIDIKDFIHLIVL